MKRIILMLSVVLGLSACASTPPNVNYYFLDSAVPVGGETVRYEERPLVLLDKVSLTEFLRQSSLLVQLEDHELHYALNHVWAEPLSDAIPNALLKDLRRANSAYYFEKMDPSWSDQAAYEVKVQIDKLYPNHEQQVVVAGRFWVKKLSDGSTVARDFSFMENQTRDGYGDAVVKMRRLITQLAGSISLAL